MHLRTFPPNHRGKEKATHYQLVTRSLQFEEDVGKNVKCYEPDRHKLIRKIDFPSANEAVKLYSDVTLPLKALV